MVASRKVFSSAPCSHYVLCSVPSTISFCYHFPLNQQSFEHTFLFCFFSFPALPPSLLRNFKNTHFHICLKSDVRDEKYEIKKLCHMKAKNHSHRLTALMQNFFLTRKAKKALSMWLPPNKRNEKAKKRENEAKDCVVRGQEEELGSKKKCKFNRIFTQCQSHSSISPLRLFFPLLARHYFDVDCNVEIGWSQFVGKLIHCFFFLFGQVFTLYVRRGKESSKKE